ncbi:hypothetical protein KEJ51_06945 [Candidatus Bathyarchaeota archaeon]|nr:hypothetical protein [Candidatus Bathyarchaeota archaeon]MBS7629003.1 hypothetical protein [Candidatus Bathyarchaeota archaeon]
MFEWNETLWAMSPNRTVLLTLTEPSGLSEATLLLEGNPTIIKRFGMNDSEGLWTLQVQDVGNMTVRLANGIETRTYINYSLGQWMEATIHGSRSVVFLDGEPGTMILLAAGNNQSIDLAVDEILQLGYVAVEFLYLDLVRFTGTSGGSTYEVLLEPIASRVDGELLGQRGRYILTLKSPNLHEIGSGCVVPVREGPIIVRLRWSSGAQTDFKAYLLKGAFIKYAGSNVSRSRRIDIRSSLTSIFKIIYFDKGEVKISEFRPHVAAVRFTDIRTPSSISNITVKSGNLDTTSDGETNYILLTNSEVLLDTDSAPLKLTLPLDVYVNGFYVKSLEIDVSSGCVTWVSLELHRLTIKVSGSEVNSFKDLKLMINNRTLPVETGGASYLLPKGTYLVSISTEDMEGSLLTQLDKDMEVKIHLRPLLRLEYLLKTFAFLQIVAITVLFGLYLMLVGSSISSAQDRQLVVE